MKKDQKIRIGIFLGRLQPQHRGHEKMIEQIFKENDKVVFCIGSAQRIRKSDPDSKNNPLSNKERIKRLKEFLDKKKFSKPYKIFTATDIQPESAWPEHLKKSCNLTDKTTNTVYFGDPISKEYSSYMRNAGFELKFIDRKKFLYRTKANTLHRISSATEIRKLENI
ncbi:MAG: adenylyltransferase/cytidyltransferase family protein [Candidatus Pacebacteria bacterium]|nr:adenylyltransferase/cytidyltransferase family protein [Candidatus Paceibacterota bacterium]